MEELALHILDLVENSIRAGATSIAIRIEEKIRDDLLTIEITDNGRGMDKDLARQAADPFFSSIPGHATGLGIPLFAQAAYEAGGSLEITSGPGKGTRLFARFRRSHIDRKPLGSIEDTLFILRQTHLDIDFQYEYLIHKD